MNRRDFLTLSVKSAMAAGLVGSIPLSLLRSHTSRAATLAAGLSDPTLQPLFVNPAPNALAGSFKYSVGKARSLRITTGQAVQMTGLVGADGSTPVPTTIWGYGTRQDGVTWPGRTLERNTADAPITVLWENGLLRNGKPLPHLLPVDTSLHWVYGQAGYGKYSIAGDGVPLVPHVHGGRNDSGSDGDPEYFFSPHFRVRGPRWERPTYTYGGPDWNDVAGMNWYHDHGLGITRLNVYAGLAGFFAVRDAADTGKPDNPLGLPADPYELGFAVQDRMFRNTGELFYPAFPGDPFYDDFITGEGVILPANVFPGGGPTALAEFFGDHMVVNGIIWPKYSVEQRQYRVRFLNGTDSRFMRLRLRVVAATGTDPGVGATMPFHIIGSDQSLRASAAQADTVDFAPGERLDLVIDFKDAPPGSRVIVENLLGDSPFGGDLPEPSDNFLDRLTDRVMAFDVDLPLDPGRPDTAIVDGTGLGGGVTVPDTAVVRKLGLYEGTDQYGRLQPLVGTAEPVSDVNGSPVNGALAFHSPVTENPALGSTEIWELYNATGDAHPIHVHLVHFQIMNREGFTADLVAQPLVQADGSTGGGYRLENIATDGNVRPPSVQEATRRDMVTALPGEVTRIKMSFDKPGHYVWHCHILSHEDHEMMRPFHVGPGPF
ncbi:MAG: multicopper oxidase domain-containing protein [Gammaproteobacteria bacterium]